MSITAARCCLAEKQAGRLGRGGRVTRTGPERTGPDTSKGGTAVTPEQRCWDNRLPAGKRKRAPCLTPSTQLNTYNLQTKHNREKKMWEIKQKKNTAQWRRHDAELKSCKTFYVSLCKIKKILYGKSQLNIKKDQTRKTFKCSKIVVYLT